MRIATITVLAGGLGLLNLAAVAETRPAWVDPPTALPPAAGAVTAASANAAPPALKAEVPPVAAEPTPPQAAVPEEVREPAPAPIQHAARSSVADEEAAPPAPMLVSAPAALPPLPKTGRAARAEARKNARLGILSGFADRAQAAPSPESSGDLARPTPQMQRAQIRVRIIHFRKGRVLAVYTRS